MDIVVLILLVFALVCFAVSAFPPSGSTINLDGAGKAFLVGALIAHLY